MSVVATLPGSAAVERCPQARAAGDGDGGTHREVDPAGGDDQGHAERHQDEGRTELEDVDEAAVEVALAHADGEEVVVEREVAEEQGEQDERGPQQAVVGQSSSDSMRPPRTWRAGWS